jgi:hypothetical protein
LEVFNECISYGDGLALYARERIKSLSHLVQKLTLILIGSVRRSPLF